MLKILCGRMVFSYSHWAVSLSDSLARSEQHLVYRNLLLLLSSALYQPSRSKLLLVLGSVDSSILPLALAWSSVCLLCSIFLYDHTWDCTPNSPLGQCSRVGSKGKVWAILLPITRLRHCWNNKWTACDPLARRPSHPRRKKEIQHAEGTIIGQSWMFDLDKSAQASIRIDPKDVASAQ